MSELQDHLWTICRKLPSDFRPWGTRDRDTAEPSEDCSCGCRHFLPLQGEAGFDWGICANAKSPRAGLLTFEQQGCPEFESETASKPERAEPPGSAGSEISPGAEAIPKPLKIHLGDFQMAFEHDPARGDTAGYFLDTHTGEVIGLYRDGVDYDELSEQIEIGLGDRYRRIEPIHARKSFRIMDDFASCCPARLRNRLQAALSGYKPFRAFKDVVCSNLEVRAQWFAFQDQAYAEIARAWLKSEGIEAEVVVPTRVVGGD